MVPPTSSPRRPFDARFRRSRIRAVRPARSPHRHRQGEWTRGSVAGPRSRPRDRRRGRRVRRHLLATATTSRVTPAARPGSISLRDTGRTDELPPRERWRRSGSSRSRARPPSLPRYAGSSKRSPPFARSVILRGLHPADPASLDLLRYIGARFGGAAASWSSLPIGSTSDAPASLLYRQLPALVRESGDAARPPPSRS